MDRSILEFHFKVDRPIFIIAYMFLSLCERFKNTKGRLLEDVYRIIDNTEAKTKRTNTRLQNITQKLSNELDEHY